MKAHRPFGSQGKPFVPQGKQECRCHWCPLSAGRCEVVCVAQEIYRRRPEASGTKGDIKSKQLTPRYAGSSVAQEGWLLFEDEGRAADLFGFEGDVDFDV